MKKLWILITLVLFMGCQELDPATYVIEKEIEEPLEGTTYTFKESGQTIVKTICLDGFKYYALIETASGKIIGITPKYILPSCVDSCIKKKKGAI